MLESFFPSVDEWFREFISDQTAVFTAVLALITLLLCFATRGLIRSAEKTAAQQLRAYIGVETLAFECGSLRNQEKVPEEPQPGYIHRDFVVTTVKNFGQTPAFDVTVFTYFSVQAFGRRLPDDFFDRVLPDLPSVDGVRTTLARFVLNHGQSEISKTVIRKSAIYAVHDAKSKKASIYVYGRIYYKDAYGRPWRTKFCYSWEPWHPPGERFVPYEEHNGEDQKEMGE